MGSQKYKIIIIGNPGVGKTSIARRFCLDEFSEDYQTTIGAHHYERSIALSPNDVKDSESGRSSSTRDDLSVRCAIWDTAGQEQYNSVRSDYYAGANFVLLTYDVTDPESLDRLKFWYDESKRNCEPFYYVVVGNKIDLVEGDRPSNNEEVKALAREFDADFYLTSAKTGEGVYEALREVVLKKVAEDHS